MTEAFRPSDVFLGQLLMGSMERAEAEYAAIVLVRALVRAGDTWKALDANKAVDVLDLDSTENVEPLSGLIRSQNPFFRPNPYELIRLGYARSVSSAGIPSEQGLIDHIEFTDAGFAALAKHVLVEPRKRLD